MVKNQFGEFEFIWYSNDHVTIEGYGETVELKGAESERFVAVLENAIRGECCEVGRGIESQRIVRNRFAMGSGYDSWNAA